MKGMLLPLGALKFAFHFKDAHSFTYLFIVVRPFLKH